MHGLTLLDEAGEVLRPAILWNDQRTGAQCDEIRAKVGGQGVIEGNFTAGDVEALVQTLNAGKEQQQVEGSDAGRLTIMQAGGSIEANVDRWIGQFKQPDGKPSREAAKIEKKEYDGLAVHLVDLSGTFAERRGGPFNPNAQVLLERELDCLVDRQPPRGRGWNLSDDLAENGHRRDEHDRQGNPGSANELAHRTPLHR